MNKKEGVPRDRVALLRAALDNVLHDKEFLATAKKIGRPIAYLSGEQVTKNVNVLNLPEGEKRKLKEIVLTTCAQRRLSTPNRDQYHTS